MEIQQCARGFILINRDTLSNGMPWREMMAFSTKGELLRYLDATISPNDPVEVNPIPTPAVYAGWGEIPRMEMPDEPMHIYDPNDATQRKR